MQPQAACQATVKVAQRGQQSCGPPAQRCFRGQWAGMPSVPSPGTQWNRQQRMQKPTAEEPKATGSERWGPEPANEPEVGV